MAVAAVPAVPLSPAGSDGDVSLFSSMASGEISSPLASSSPSPLGTTLTNPKPAGTADSNTYSGDSLISKSDSLFGSSDGLVTPQTSTPPVARQDPGQTLAVTAPSAAAVTASDTATDTATAKALDQPQNQSSTPAPIPSKPASVPAPVSAQTEPDGSQSTTKKTYAPPRKHDTKQPTQEEAPQPSLTLAQVEQALPKADHSNGLDLPSPLQLFLQYDTDGSRAIGRAEFKQLLLDLDGLQEVPDKEVDQYVKEQFDSADLNHDGILSIDEWYYAFYSSLCFKFPTTRTGCNPGADLFNIFTKYCSSGKKTRTVEMESHQFAKLIKASKLINSKVNKADVDIIYSRAKAETEVMEKHIRKPGSEWTSARLGYSQFLFALLRLAEKRRTGFQEVVGQIIANVSAIPAPSQADLLIFTNTGDPVQLEEWVLRPRGLPALPRVANDSSERMKKEAELAKLLQIPLGKQGQQPPSGGQGTPPDPEDLKLHGAHPGSRKKWGFEEFGSAESLGLPRIGKAALNDPEVLLAVRRLNPDQMMMGLKRTFELYNLFDHGVNKSAMDKIRFCKVLRDSELVKELGALSAAQADAIYSKVLPNGKMRINFIEFIEALRHVATSRRSALNEIMERVLIVNVPQPF